METTNYPYYGTISVNIATYAYSACLNATSDAECISSYRPPLRHDLTFTVSITLVYSVLGILGVFGNALVIAVVSHLKEMQTGSNIYLLNLAIADLLIVVTGLPLELHEYWYAYPHPGGDGALSSFLCVFRHWASELAAYSSVMTICLFTFERAISVQCANKLSSSHPTAVKRATISIAIIWIVAGTFATLVSYQWRIDKILTPDGRLLAESSICIPKEELNTPAMFIVPVVLFFFLPMGLITIFYMMIFRAIKSVSNLLRYGQIESPPPTSNMVMANLGSTVSSIRSPPQIIKISTGNYNQSSSPVLQGTRTENGRHRQSEQPLLSGTGSHLRQYPPLVNLPSIDQDATEVNDHRTTTVIKVQTAVTLTFFSCWAPFHCQRLIVQFGQPETWTESDLKVYHIFNAIAGVLYYLETCINPAIYNLLSQRFRKAFKTTLHEFANSKTICFLFKNPHKTLMARLYGPAETFRNVRPLVAPNHQRFQSNIQQTPDNRRQVANQPEPIYSPHISPPPLLQRPKENFCALIENPREYQSSSDAVLVQNNQQTAELCPANIGAGLQKLQTNSGAILLPARGKIIQEARPLHQSPITCQTQSNLLSPKNALCLHCKHPSRQQRANSLIPPSTASSPPSSGDDSKQPSSDQIACLTSNIHQMVMRRYSDQPSSTINDFRGDDRQFLPSSVCADSRESDADLPSESVGFLGSQEQTQNEFRTALV